MSLSSPEVIEFCKTLSPGDRLKAVQHDQMLCSIVPNDWYTVKNIEVRPYGINGGKGDEVIIVVKEFPDNKFSPYWFGICDASSQVLNAERGNYIMKSDTSDEVKKFLNQIQIGDEVKAISDGLYGTSLTRVDLTPNKWYTVCDIDNGSKSITVIDDSGKQSHYCPEWFGITNSDRTRLKVNAEYNVRKGKPVVNCRQEQTRTSFSANQLIRKTVSWAIVEPFKKTVQLAVFGGILFTGYKTVTDPAFFMKLLPKIQIEIGNQGK